VKITLSAFDSVLSVEICRQSELGGRALVELKAAVAKNDTHRVRVRAPKFCGSKRLMLGLKTIRANKNVTKNSILRMAFYQNLADVYRDVSFLQRLKKLMDKYLECFSSDNRSCRFAKMRIVWQF
jgi:hypothetical protein